jgi:hypothetical protein
LVEASNSIVIKRYGAFFNIIGSLSEQHLSVSIRKRTNAPLLPHMGYITPFFCDLQVARAGMMNSIIGFRIRVRLSIESIFPLSMDVLGATIMRRIRAARRSSISVWVWKGSFSKSIFF